MMRGAKLLTAVFFIFCLGFFAFPRIIGSYAYVLLIYKINEDRLEDAAAALRSGCVVPLAELRGIRGVSFESSDGTVGFSCAAFGIAPSGFYAGLYNSPDGAPKSFHDSNMELRRDGESWIYEEPGGDNRYITRRIKRNWYYYRMSF